MPRWSPPTGFMPGWRGCSSGACDPRLSCPDLIRASILFATAFFNSKWMDCRVRPGNDNLRSHWLPFHPQYRPSRGRIHVLAGMNKSVALVEANGAGVVLVDQERDAIRRPVLCLIDQYGCEVRAPAVRSDHQLIEIA